MTMLAADPPPLKREAQPVEFGPRLLGIVAGSHAAILLVLLLGAWIMKPKEYTKIMDISFAGELGEPGGGSGGHQGDGGDDGGAAAAAPTATTPPEPEVETQKATPAAEAEVAPIVQPPTPPQPPADVAKPVPEPPTPEATPVPVPEVKKPDKKKEQTKTEVKPVVKPAETKQTKVKVEPTPPQPTKPVEPKLSRAEQIKKDLESAKVVKVNAPTTAAVPNNPRGTSRPISEVGAASINNVNASDLANRLGQGVGKGAGSGVGRGTGFGSGTGAGNGNGNGNGTGNGVGDGPGGSLAGMNYESTLSGELYKLWRQPSRTLAGTDKVLQVPISLTIMRDGRVVAKAMTGRSGNAAMDNSVSQLIDSINRMPPFPPDLRPGQMTFAVNMVLDR